MKGRLAGVAAVVLVAVGGVAAAQYRDPGHGGAGGPARTQVSLPATGLAAVPVCPGPQTLVVPAGGQPIAPAGPVAVGAVVEGSPGSPAGRATLGGRRLTVGDSPFGLLTSPRASAGPVSLQASRSAAAPAMSAVQLGLARQGDQRGLSALSCSVAATQTWLVGGGTQAGRRGHLLLANPAATPAAVDVVVHGPGGPIEAPAGTGVVVPPEAQLALRLDALAPDLDTAAVLVRARSGRVIASLHDNWVRGVTPSGVDDVSAAAPAARRQVVPGISVAPPGGQQVPETATAPGAVAVRVVNPGSAEVVAGVRLLGEAGPVVLPGAVLTLGPGEVRDLPLSTVPPGVYAAVVEADAPVVAGAVVGRTMPGGQIAGTDAAIGVSVPPSEFGWAASVLPLAGTTLVSLPELAETGRRAGISATLTVAAPDGAGSVEVVEIDSAGAPLGSGTLLVAAGSGEQRVLSAKAAAVRLRPVSGSGPLMAALLLQLPDPAGPMVSVLPVRPGPTGSGARPHVVADVRVGLRG